MPNIYNLHQRRRWSSLYESAFDILEQDNNDNDNDNDDDASWSRFDDDDAENVAPTDADDSIVLSDLVRTGEASRLRRRGALRIDHAHASAPNPAPPSNFQSSSPAIVVVGLPASFSSDGTDVEDEQGPLRERPSRYLRPHYHSSQQSQQQQQQQQQLLQQQQSQQQQQQRRRQRSRLGLGLDANSTDATFTLFCGGGGGGEDDSYTGSDVDDGDTPFVPSPLPLYPPPPSTSALPSPYSTSRRRRASKSNGCGALLHTHASPRSRQATWEARGAASSAVVVLDPSYFSRSTAAKLTKSACGCVREGIGCAVCGNVLGIRYTACKTAGDRLPSARQKPSGPLHPEGPRYWRAHAHAQPPPSSSTSHQRPTTHVYTFFADAVSSSPAHKFSTAQRGTRASPSPSPSPSPSSMPFGSPSSSATRSTLRRGPPEPAPVRAVHQSAQLQTLAEYNRARAVVGRAVEDRGRRQDDENEGDAMTTTTTTTTYGDGSANAETVFDGMLTASPRPLSDVALEEDRAENAAPYYRFVVPVPSLERDVVVGGGSGEVDAYADATRDPDGEFIFDTEPSSPDKTYEAMLFPER